MGSNASKGSNNDELVDNLLADNYLKTTSIQQIFRAVDRGLYFTKDNRKHAYDDTAWRDGNIHLSAPGIYCEVLENLELGEGMSFLNLGSGTGYLNTMAGLILGSYGVNYGVEVRKDVIQYAYNRLEKFKWTAEAIDEYDFCEPKFFEGNCLHLSNENRLYDRVYCGAACPPSYENYMKNLIKVNGILVMPLEEVLVKVRRISETSWKKISITPVNFAHMIPPSPCDANKPQLLLSNPEPLSLQDICRTSIRQILLKIIREENPQLKNHRIRKDLCIRSRRNGFDNPRPRTSVTSLDQVFVRNREMFLARGGYEPCFLPWLSVDVEDFRLEEDDNSSMEREEAELDRRELDESDEDMERNEKETDSEEKEDDEKRTERKSEGSGDCSRSVQRLPSRTKRKKAQKTSTSNPDSGTDVEGMDVEYLSNDSKKPDNGDQELKVNSTSDSSMAGDSSVEKSSDGAGCSSNVNEESSAESDDYDDESSVEPHRCRKLREMMVWQHRLRKAKKGHWSPRSSDVEESEDDSREGKTVEPPTVSPSYSVLMREKITSLPLPRSVQSYLNFHRTF